MKKMILFIIILLNTMSINAILEDPHWFDIVNYITENSEKNNRNEFEAAKQAYLNRSLTKLVINLKFGKL